MAYVRFLQNPPNPTLNCNVVNNDIMELSGMKLIRNWIRKKYEFDTNLFTNAQLNGNLQRSTRSGSLGPPDVNKLPITEPEFLIVFSFFFVFHLSNFCLAPII